ncbi:MAG: autotransporter outer membrane beta-barrel domain-containing protein [Planctomycetaceae bacterium]|jgi:uncharacterized protein with beta-barrel porin domain|nr:autotransporter outer membrane beta-barrel domain-containing protein [Planctomycetaceae bacterium]
MRLLLAGIFLLAAAVTYAQPPLDYRVWDPVYNYGNPPGGYLDNLTETLYTGHENRTYDNRYTRGRVELGGSVSGYGGNRPHEWIIYGHLTNRGFVENLRQLDIYSGNNSGTIDSVTTINVHDYLSNSGTIQNGNQGEDRGRITVSQTLTNTNVNGTPGLIQNYEYIEAREILNNGTITTDTQLYITTSGGNLVNGSGNVVDPDQGRGLISAQYLYIDVTGDLTNKFNGDIEAGSWGDISVTGRLYNAGSIRFNSAFSSIEAGSLYNDGRLYSQGGDIPGDQNRGIIYDVSSMSIATDLTNIGANAVINGAVASAAGSYMHIGGNLFNADRASLFNYGEIIVHGDIVNQGATLVGGHWFTHSDGLTFPSNPPQMYQAGHIGVGGNVRNISEKPDDSNVVRGGLIASFDLFQVHGSLLNDAYSIVTGSYEHSGTGPGIDSDVIYGRRANILGGQLIDGEYHDAASVLTVRGLANDPVLHSDVPFYGIYNEGHIREIDIINVGSDERGVLWNVLGIQSPHYAMPTVGNGEGILTLSTEMNSSSGTITDIGVINTTNLINGGTISNIDVAINVSYALINTSSGVLDGLSASHVEWTYDADGVAESRRIVQQTTRADLIVGKATAENEFLRAAFAERANNNAVGIDSGTVPRSVEGIGIVNLGAIMNFNTVSTTGDFYNSGIVANVEAVVVGRDLYLERGSDFGNVGTITANGNIRITGNVDGGFTVLSAKNGVLQVGVDNYTTFAGFQSYTDYTGYPGYLALPIDPTDPSFPFKAEKKENLPKDLSQALLNVSGKDLNEKYLNSQFAPTRMRLTIDRGSMASGYIVKNYGLIINNGLLNSGTTVLNEGFLFNNGTISTFNGFVNHGVITGKGMVMIAAENGSFVNNEDGLISGGLVVNGYFRNANGKISLLNPTDIIRVTNGKATINGGEVDTSAYKDMEVGTQYLFLVTDRPGDLHVIIELRGTGSGGEGSVLDLTPVFGSWDGKRYVPGKTWDPKSNQYYWLEVQRAYHYQPYAKTHNQVAVGRYIDTISSTVRRDSPLWNLLVQLDGISENDPGYDTHREAVSPKALRALDELSGVSYANIGPASIHNVGVVNRTLADVLRSDVFKFSYVGNPNNAIRGQAIAPLRYTRWGTLFGIGGSVTSDGNSSGYDQSFGGVMAGIDRALWTGTRVGGWVSAATGDVSQKSVHEKTEITTVMAGVYVRQEMYYGYGLLSAGFGSDEYKTTRMCDATQYRATAKHYGTIGTVYMERGIDIPVYYATVQPYVNLQLAALCRDKFSETMWDHTGQSSKVGLVGDKGETYSYRGALGIRASSMPVAFKWGQIALTTNAAWYHEFNSDKEIFTGQFANPNNCNFVPSKGESFKILGNDPKRDWLNFGFGLNMDRNSTRIFLSPDLYINSRQSLFSATGGVITSW